MVFDSVNGSTLLAKDGKPLRSAVKEKSPHILFWTDAIQIFQSMKFINRVTGKHSVPPCINNWIQTLRGFIYIWNYLKRVHKFQFLIPRNINQDPIECFFGSIRSHGVRNTNPSSSQFISSFKTLLINNLSSVKSIGNCETDDCSMLDNLKSFLEGPKTNDNYSEIVLNIPLLDLSNTCTKSKFNAYTFGYVGGYIARSILKCIQNCECCKNDISDNNVRNNLIKVRSYTKNSLRNPTKNFELILEKIYTVLSYYTPLICHSSNITLQLDLAIELNIEFKLNCIVHNLKDIIKKKVIHFFLFSYTKKINLILKGKILNNNKINDKLQQIAFDYYKKHKAKKIRIDNLKKGS